MELCKYFKHTHKRINSKTKNNSRAIKNVISYLLIFKNYKNIEGEFLNFEIKYSKNGKY